jgi:hypothetical protein
MALNPLPLNAIRQMRATKGEHAKNTRDCKSEHCAPEDKKGKKSIKRIAGTRRKGYICIPYENGI